MYKSIIGLAVFLAATAASANPLAGKGTVLNAVPASTSQSDSLWESSKIQYELTNITSRETVRLSSGGLSIEDDSLTLGLKLAAKKMITPTSRVTGEISYRFGEASQIALGNHKVFDFHAQYEVAPAKLLGIVLSGGAGVSKDDLKYDGVKLSQADIYVTVGAERRFNLGKQWQVVPAAKYKHFLKSTLSIQKFESHDLVSGKGVEFSLSFENTRRDGSGWLVTPYIRKIEKSFKDNTAHRNKLCIPQS